MTRPTEVPAPEETGTHEMTRRPSDVDATIPQRPDEVPVHRPWARRPDAHAVERRFRRDRAGWRRRIDCARRLSHDAADPLVAPYQGAWTSEWARSA